MSICDMHYVFTFVNIGNYGSNLESDIFRNSTIGKRSFNKKMNLLPLGVTDKCPSLGELPFLLVDDEAFPLQTWFLRPYPGTD